MSRLWRPAPFRRIVHLDAQRGIATVLIVLLLGLSLTAGVLGTASYVRTSQEQDTAVHAQTQAQMKAWTGAELVGQYLKHLSETGTSLATLLDKTASKEAPLSLQIQGDGVANTIEAKIVAIDKTASPPTVTVHITGVAAPGTRAEARTKLEVVYTANGGSSGNKKKTPPRPSVLTYNRNLKMGGSITVLKDNNDQTPFEINVIGDISTGGNSITGVGLLNATGSAYITSGSSFDELHSNCDVSISGSVKITHITARRNYCATGTAGTGSNGSITANGSVTTAAANGDNGKIYSRAATDGVQSCNAPGFNPAWNSSEAPTCALPAFAGINFNNGNAGAKLAQTKGSVEIQSGSLEKIEAQGNLKVTSSGSVNSGTIGGKLQKPEWNSNVKVKIEKGYTVNPPEAPLVSIETEKFNAYDLNIIGCIPNGEESAEKCNPAYKNFDISSNDPKTNRCHASVQSQANYIFAIDNKGFKRVVVKNIAGMADCPGDGSKPYYIGKYDSGPYKDYLCTAVTGSASDPTCTSPAVTASKTLCEGYSTSNPCFSYENSKDTWTINGKSIAPGVAWFEGNLEIGNGTYYNTFISTKNIKTAGSHKNYAPNYAGYSGKLDGQTYAPQGICTNTVFPSLKPTQFCTADSKFNPTDIGNYAFMAGSWPQGVTYQSFSDYLGGDIELGSSTEVFGSVKAGNQFISGGSTTIHGYASALGLGVEVKNSMGGSTTFNLRKLPSTFIPTGSSDSGSSSEGSGSGAGSSGTGGGQIKMKWARYL